MDSLDQVFGPPQIFDPREPQHHWYLFTDGSGGTQGISGWGVGIFTTKNPNASDRWAAALYGPVLTEAWDPLWLGADRHSNNTAELSAIGEACRWLLEQCSAAENTNEWEGMILYDSQYAYGVATRLFNPDTNLGLATTVASLVDSVRSKMKLDFTHVRGHRGIHGNEIADRLANRLRKTNCRPKHRSCREASVRYQPGWPGAHSRTEWCYGIWWSGSKKTAVVRSTSYLLRVSHPDCCMKLSVKRLIGACMSWRSWQGQTDVYRYIPTGVPFKEKAKAREKARPKEKANKRARQPASKMRTS